MVLDFIPTDDLSVIQPSSRIAYNCANSVFYSQAISLAGNVGWTPVQKLLGAYAGQRSIFAVQALQFAEYDAVDPRTGLPLPTSMVFCTVFLSFLQVYVQSLQNNIGENGAVLILEANGNLIATSRLSILQDFQSESATSISQSANGYLQSISSVLTEYHFIDSGNQTRSSLADIRNHPIDIDGAACHFEATILPTTALRMRLHSLNHVFIC